MGTQGSGLPDLPPEWGEVIIPDNAAELDREAARVRKELRRQSRRRRWRKRLHLPAHIDDPEHPSLLLPLMVLGAAILITLMSLILVAWPSLTRPPQEQFPPSPASSLVTASP